MEPEYFDKLYERYDDPWHFVNRWYEKRKRALTLASLPAERYTSVLELGCSIGVLTEQLAQRADSLVAVDLSAAAVERAHERLEASGFGAGVRIEQRDISTGLPDGEFDLIVLSEVGYYFDWETLGHLLDDIHRHLSATGTLVLCHWRHPVADYPLRGEDVHVAMTERSSLVRVASHDEADFLLDVYTRTGTSVADAEGLLS
jgi:cyclopropane fatty-acyl-phospholipid synthase-like methyltransferase